MRKICLIGLCVCALCGRANAAVSGFSDNSSCGGCIAFMGCAAQVGYNKYGDRGDCGTDTDRDVNSYVTAAIAQCSSSSFPGSSYQQYVNEIAKTGANIGAAYYYDSVCYPGMTSDQWQQMKVGYALSFLDACRKIGACYCGSGTYVQPMGLVDFSWGTNSKCLACPTSGTTDSSVFNVFITSCYIPAGNSFTDDIGSGVVSGKCPYTLDDENDVYSTVQ